MATTETIIYALILVGCIVILWMLDRRYIKRKAGYDKNYIKKLERINLSSVDTIKASADKIDELRSEIGDLKTNNASLVEMVEDLKVKLETEEAKRKVAEAENTRLIKELNETKRERAYFVAQYERLTGKEETFHG